MKRIPSLILHLVTTVFTSTVTSTWSYNNDSINLSAATTPHSLSNRNVRSSESSSSTGTLAVANKYHHDNDESHHTVVSFAQVEAYLNSIGYTIDNFCQQHYTSNNYGNDNVVSDSLNQSHRSFVRRLDEKQEEEEQKEEEQSNYIQNIILAFICVTIAALAAGLTMGLLSLELLDLRIKEIASSNTKEREQARSLVPLIKDHHRLVRLMFDIYLYFVQYLKWKLCWFWT